MLRSNLSILGVAVGFALTVTLVVALAVTHFAPQTCASEPASPPAVEQAAAPTDHDVATLSRRVAIASEEITPTEADRRRAARKLGGTSAPRRGLDSLTPDEP